MRLTIFTPTYNRATTIVRTYKSLLQQSCKDFEWLIVDDGSTDGTGNIVRPWLQEENGFTIWYIQQPNGGKYRAYNEGLRQAQGDLFFCVDSDDWLPANSVELILSKAEQLFSSDNYAGIVALKNYADGSLIGKQYTTCLSSSSLYNLESIGQGGERSLVFKTAIAKQYPFPEVTNEKFVTESVIYDRMEPMEFLICNDVLTTCEYQSDGLSSNVRDTMLKNPTGYMIYYAQRVDLAGSLVERFLLATRYHAFRSLSPYSGYRYNGTHSLLVSLSRVFSPIIRYYYTR